jgi:hypothetical protein
VTRATMVAARTASRVAERWTDRRGERQAREHACENLASANLLHAASLLPANNWRLTRGVQFDTEGGSIVLPSAQ